MSRNIIFLDVDGVLNNYDTKELVPNTGFTGIDDRYVANLKIICDENNADIVLSSSWRINHDTKKLAEDSETFMKYLKSKLAKYDLEIKGYTPIVNGFKRGEEIISYLIENEYDNYIILDDENFDFELCGIDDRHIKTSFYKLNGGINREVIATAKELFSKQPEHHLDIDYLNEIRNIKLGYDPETYNHVGIALE